MIIRNSLKTPDGTKIVSYHRHDYKEYIDKNGKTYFVDGGKDYLRRSNNGDEKDTSITSKDKFKKIRKVLEWGTRGKDGKSKLRYVKLKNLDTDHIKAILETQYQISNIYIKFFEKELAYRLKLKG